MPSRRAGQVLERLIAFVVLLMLLFGISTYTRGDAFGLPWGLGEDADAPSCDECARHAVGASLAPVKRGEGHSRAEDAKHDDEKHDDGPDEADKGKDGHRAKKGHGGRGRG